MRNIDNNIIAVPNICTGVIFSLRTTTPVMIEIAGSRLMNIVHTVGFKLPSA